MREKTRRLLFLALGLACVSTAAGTMGQQRLTQVYKGASEALSHGRYLDAVDMLRPLAIDHRGRILDPTAYQLWNQVQVNITGESYRAPSNSAEGDNPEIARQLSEARAQPAIASIVSRARSTNIVMLNEDHVHSSQRAFALEVARALRPLGYNVLALEALSNTGDSVSRMGALERRGYVVLSDGFYTRDPVFADFIRQSLRLGFAPASYEYTGKRDGTDDERIAAREQGQAENLLAIIKSHPDAKLLIYVGQSHLAEAPLKHDEGRLSWMAARLTKLTGIDPLTVDQATLESGCGVCRRLSKADYQPVAFFRGTKPIIVGKYAGAVDLQVFKPQQRRIAGRHGWLSTMGRKETRVPSKLLPKRGERLVQAFLASEPQNAIPLDQLIVRAGDHGPKFMLPHAKVRFSFQQRGLTERATLPPRVR